MKKKDVIFNFTLEQYNKKYRNRRHRLIKYTKKQIEEFDEKYGHYEHNKKTYNLKTNHYLLKNRKWALIGDTYYEIPKPIRFTWFRNLRTCVQIAICTACPIVIASAIVVPIEIIKYTPDVKVIGANFDKANSKIALNEESTIAFIYPDNKIIDKVNHVKVGDTKIPEGPDGYELIQGNNHSSKIKICAKAMTSVKISVSIEYKEIYTVTIASSPAVGGTSSVSKSTGLFYNDQVELTASANDEYDFLGFYDGNTKLSDSSPYTYTVTASKNLIAKFKQRTYALTLQSDPADIGAELTGGGDYPYNTQVTITAKPVDDYTFLGWYDGDTKETDEMSFTYTTTKTPKTFTAKYKRKEYALTLKATPSGIGTTLTGNGNYISSSKVNISATAVTNYNFNGWYDGDTLLSKNLSFEYTTGKSAKTLTASFTPRVDAVTLDKTEIYSSKNATEKLTATVAPTSPTKKVTWDSDNKAVATVDTNGNIKCIADGVANITATSVDDPTKSATCKVTIDSNVLDFIKLTDTTCSVVPRPSVVRAGYNVSKLIIPEKNPYNSNQTVTTIPDDAFNFDEGNEYIKTVVLPSTLTTLGTSCFYGCSSLTTINLADTNVTVIPSNAFCETALTSISFNSGITEIGESAFMMTQISSVDLSTYTSLTTVLDFAFGACGATSIKFNDTITTLGEGAFAGNKCTFTVQSGGNYSTFDDNKALVYQGNTLLCYCNAPSTPTIPNYITTIGSYAFVSSSIVSITIPSNVTKIEANAFNSCYYQKGGKLKTMTFAETTQWYYLDYWTSEETAANLTNASTNAKNIGGSSKEKAWVEYYRKST